MSSSPPVFGGYVLLIFLVLSVVSLILFVFVQCLVYTVLPVCLDCHYLITPSVYLVHPRFLMGFVLLDLKFYVYIL